MDSSSRKELQVARSWRSERATDSTLRPTSSHPGNPGGALTPDQRTEQDLWQTLPGQGTGNAHCDLIRSPRFRSHQDSEAKLFLKIPMMRDRVMVSLGHDNLYALELAIQTPVIHM